MKKTLIFYFTKTGNNKFIAQKISEIIIADTEVIIPKIRSFFLLMLFSWLKINISIKPISSNIEKYEKVIIIGPIWVGKLIAPLRGFLKKYRDKMREIVFITVCGSGVEDKDGKFGYEGVFREIRSLLPSKNISCYEISTKDLNESTASQADKPLISEEVFKGEIKSRFDEIVEFLKK